MDNRRYVKRIWRVPTDRGALEYFATLVTKAMVKHGWPAKWQEVPDTDGFLIQHVDYEGDLPDDMQAAAEIAVRIIARTYRVEVIHQHGWIGLNREYRVSHGHFREVKP